MEFIDRYPSLLGGIVLAADGEYLTGLRFDGQKDRRGLPETAYTEKELPVFEQTKKWLDIYFRGADPGFTPPLRIRATGFCRAVLDILTTVPYGQTVTYGEIAKRIAEERGLARMSAQAVGGAVGRNPIALIVPCHRVIGAGGALIGYAGGIERKRALLALESEPCPYEN